jgi:hypothetical protein
MHPVYLCGSLIKNIMQVDGCIATWLQEYSISKIFSPANELTGDNILEMEGVSKR